MPETFDLLQRLSETPGPSGFEEPIAAAIRAEWEPLTDELRVDRVGSLTAVKRGTQPRDGRPLQVMLVAHMDEIGLLVAEVVEHGGYGFVRLAGLGGVDRRQLYGQLAVIYGRRPLTGVIGALPRHMLPDDKREKTLDYEELFIDPGLPIATVRDLVSIGDYAGFHQPLRKLLNGRAAGKSIDNRSSVTAVTLCLQQLQGRDHSWDVIAAATSQEETRLLGAGTSAYAYEPDIAIAIDVTHGKGPGTSDHESFELGGGPVLGLGANLHPGVTKALKDAAAALEMSVSMEPHTSYSGTDADALQTARAGIPTGLVQLPLRYMHTMVETIDLADIERVGRLLAEFIARLDAGFLDTLREELL
jgi:endoglucanase